MLMLWTCCLSFAQEEKNELGLLLGAEFIPQATLILRDIDELNIAETSAALE
jgi:hypothetical protein